MKRLVFALLLSVTLLLGAGPIASADDDSTGTGASSPGPTTETSESATEPEPEPEEPVEPPERFVPTEKVSADTPIAFPVDI